MPSYKPAIKKKILTLLSEYSSAESLLDALSKDPKWENERLPDPKTIRNWRKKKDDNEPRLMVQEKKLARQHDIEIFKKSEEIMSETKAIAHMNRLQTPDWSIRSKWWPDTNYYLWFFSFEGNRYVNRNLDKLCKKWLDAFYNLEDSAATYFFSEGDRYAFMPAGYQHYIHCTDEAQPEYQRAFKELESLSKEAKKAYIKYREAIKQTLYI